MVGLVPTIHVSAREIQRLPSWTLGTRPSMTVVVYIVRRAAYSSSASRSAFGISGPTLRSR
jgi:hypothetical protein